MMTTRRIMLAAYGVPGIFAIEHLFAAGFTAGNLSLLSHPRDSRNAVLLDFAESHGIPVCLDGATTVQARDWVAARSPDALFSIHYRTRIPAAILSLPKLGAVNLHPSLLPDYRGCFSVPWVLVNGETRTGYTWHYMDEDFDTGRILVQEEVAVEPEDTAFSLFHRLIVAGLSSFGDIVRKIMVERDPGREQPAGGSYHPRRLPYDGRIDLAWGEARVERFLRAMFFPPLKGAVMEVGGQDHSVETIEDFRCLRDRLSPHQPQLQPQTQAQE